MATDTRRRARVICYPWHATLGSGISLSGNVIAVMFGPGPGLALEPRAKIQADIQAKVAAEFQRMGVSSHQGYWTPVVDPPFIVSPELLRLPNAADWFQLAPSQHVCRTCWEYEATQGTTCDGCAATAPASQ